jgi:MFS family permease
VVAGVSFLVLIGTSGFRALPSVVLTPIHDDLGWSHGTVSAAISVNLVLVGLAAPYAAALIERLGIRAVLAAALVLIGLGTGLPAWMSAPWQLFLAWGLLVGAGCGAISLAFVATLTNRWFVRRRGVVTGVLTAASTAGQLAFLPLLGWLSEHSGWRVASVVVAIFYGLDWIATVPPTIRLCQEWYGESAGIVFGWLWTTHQVGGAIAAAAGGLIRDHLGSYSFAWFVAGMSCLVAAGLSLRIPSRPHPPTAAPAEPAEPAERLAAVGGPADPLASGSARRAGILGLAPADQRTRCGLALASGPAAAPARFSRLARGWTGRTGQSPADPRRAAKAEKPGPASPGLHGACARASFHAGRRRRRPV